nr:venom peptide [Acharia stimulea]
MFRYLLLALTLFTLLHSGFGCGNPGAHCDTKNDCCYDYYCNIGSQCKTLGGARKPGWSQSFPRSY